MLCWTGGLGSIQIAAAGHDWEAGPWEVARQLVVTRVADQKIVVRVVTGCSRPRRDCSPLPRYPAACLNHLCVTGATTQDFQLYSPNSIEVTL